VAACRFCRAELRRTFVDLGMSPLCETFLTAEELNRAEAFYPLHVQVCEECLLVQLEEYVSPDEIFTDYPYFSSYSESWLRHAARYVDRITERLGLDGSGLVVELGSNDGYLLKHVVAKGIPVLGIEPARNVAEVANAAGVRTRPAFFGPDLAEEVRAEGSAADLIVANNVLAQVPDLNGFVAGIGTLLKPSGVATIEFPHLMRLVTGNQFDTIYHEHFSYFSFLAAERVFAAHGLAVFDVEELESHGGSLRLYACHAGPAGPAGAMPHVVTPAVTPAVDVLREKERAAGVHRIEYYDSFATRVEATKRKLLDLLIDLRNQGKKIVGYGAPGKGNTLLNYCGIRRDFLEFTVDRNPHKHGRFLPGTHVPIGAPEDLDQAKPDYVLILPWNLKDEIMQQLAHVRDWGCRFIVPIPEARVYD
jgi:SAM-dependent methyltransferase